MLIALVDRHALHTSIVCRTVFNRLPIGGKNLRCLAKRWYLRSVVSLALIFHNLQSRHIVPHPQRIFCIHSIFATIHQPGFSDHNHHHIPWVAHVWARVCRDPRNWYRAHRTVWRNMKVIYYKNQYSFKRKFFRRFMNFSL